MSGKGGTARTILIGDLPRNSQKARFGVAYVRAVCAQAGYRLSEVDPDEDHAAFDCSVGFPGIEVRVQVKCTAAAFTKKRATLGWAVGDHWRQRWSSSKLPVYFVVVKLWNNPCEDWVEYRRESTSHRATAYWTRIDPRAVPDRVEVKRSSRFTIETLAEWAHDLDRAFA